MSELLFRVVLVSICIASLHSVTISNCGLHYSVCELNNICFV